MKRHAVDRFCEIAAENGFAATYTISGGRFVVRLYGHGISANFANSGDFCELKEMFAAIVKRAARGKAALMSMYADILAEWYLKKRKEEKR